jgi:hypothetical protein
MLTGTEVVALIGVLSCIIGSGIVAINSKQLREEEAERSALYAIHERERLLRRIEMLEAEAPDYDIWLRELHSTVDQQFSRATYL